MAQQDRCTNPDCNHPASFHGNGTTDCRALGCGCGAWRDEKGPWVERSITAAEAAEVLGRSVRWVREHAEELRGRQVKGGWRFDPDDLKTAV